MKDRSSYKLVEPRGLLLQESGMRRRSVKNKELGRDRGSKCLKVGRANGEGVEKGTHLKEK